jgi:hypothetical protein
MHNISSFNAYFYRKNEQITSKNTFVVSGQITALMTPTIAVNSPHFSAYRPKDGRERITFSINLDPYNRLNQ